MRHEASEAAVGSCLGLLVIFIFGAPLTLFSTWLTGVMWDWPILGIGWWSDHSVPDWELRWVVAATTLAVVSRISTD